MKKIAYLGMGAWGYCLASLLASKHHQLHCWTTKPALVETLTATHEHPLLKGFKAKGHMTFSTSLAEVIDDAEIIIESVTSAGLRPVLNQLKLVQTKKVPLIITSKGIEQNTGKILPEVAVEVLGETYRGLIGCLSGPSFAQEVIHSLPTSVVGSGFSNETIELVCEIFKTPTFRVYPNADILGVEFGGALKNIVAIACGLAEGLSLGYSCKAALMTRGLHEIRKLAVACGCKAETIYGLSGMGDLCLTCSSSMSRNFKFGSLLAKGISVEEAHQQIGMVIEGSYTCVSALQLSKQYKIPMPITEVISKIITSQITPKEAVKSLMQRAIKEEHL